MGGEARRVLVWVAAGLVVVGVAVGAFSVGRAAAGPAAATTAGDGAVVDTATEGVTDAPVEVAPTDSPPQPEAKAQPASGSVVVYISGAVAQPDTYTLPADARVKDVVLAAGGLSDDAAADSVNLAERIADAQHIHIPRIGEAPVAQAQAQGAASLSGGTSKLVNLNTASPAELEGLPRIGAALAARIVEWRTANGPFGALEDVQKVKGVSASVFDEIKALVSVE